jgi:hypothetical protein
VIIPTPGTPPPGGWPSNVFYQDPAGELSNEDAFNYNASTNTLAVENITGSTVTGSGVVKGSNTFGQRYATQAATNRAAADTASLTVERYFTVTAEGNGESFNIQSNTPSAGNKIVRKIWYKDEAFEATDVDTWTLLHTFADDATYASTATKWQEYLDGQSNGTPPFTLAISWEEQTLFTGLLDTYSGAAAAYSLRLLDSTYTGDAIRVRRASDNTEQDIGFDGNGDLDTSALATFCAGTNGFIRTWYDQSGNANHATQGTTANQPKIYDSVTGVILQNSLSALEFDGSNDEIPTGQNIRVFTIFAVATADDNTSNVIVGSATDTNEFFRTEADAARIQNNQGVTVSAVTTNQNLIYALNDLTSQIGVNGGSVATGATQNDSFDALTIGQKAGAFFYYGRMQEIIIYDSDQSANRTGIETNINDYYSIY